MQGERFWVLPNLRPGDHIPVVEGPREVEPLVIIHLPVVDFFDEFRLRTFVNPFVIMLHVVQNGGNAGQGSLESGKEFQLFERRVFGFTGINFDAAALAFELPFGFVLAEKLGRQKRQECRQEGKNLKFGRLHTFVFWKWGSNGVFAKGDSG